MTAQVDTRMSPSTLASVVQTAAKYAITDSYDEARYVHDLMRHRAGLLKVRPVPPPDCEHLPATLSALGRQAALLFDLMIAGRL